jgi:hypothetical protein
MFSDAVNRVATFTLTGSGSIASTAGTGVTATITSVGNGWYRCSMAVTTTLATSGSGFQIRDAASGDGTTGVYLWGAQAELGNIASPYTVTTTAAVTTQNAINANGGTILVDSTGTMNLTASSSSGFNLLNNATNYVTVSKIAALNEWDITASNTSNLGFVSTGGGGINLYTTTGGSQKQLAITATASANNYVQVTGGAGVGPIISAVGADTNIDLKLTPKGTGYANITSGGIKFPDATVQTTAATAGLASAGNSSIGIFNTNITANATIAGNTNGFSVGPVTVANGVSVTVTSGQRWVTI